MADLFDLLSRLNFIQLLGSLSSLQSLKSKAGTESNPPQASNGKSDQVPFSELIKQASAAYGIDEKVISAVIKQESSFNPQAISSCGAQGLMQLMPATASSLGVTNAFDAKENIMAGTRYLRQKLDEFGGDLSLALAAYNAGSGAVRKHGGIPPYRETQAYVKKIMQSVDYMA